MDRKNLIVGQSGGPTAVINSSLYGIVKGGRDQAEVDRIYRTCLWNGKWN